MGVGRIQRKPRENQRLTKGTPKESQKSKENQTNIERNSKENQRNFKDKSKTNQIKYKYKYKYNYDTKVTPIRNKKKIYIYIYTPGPYRRASAWLCGVHEERFQRSSTSQADRKQKKCGRPFAKFRGWLRWPFGVGVHEERSNAPPTPAQPPAEPSHGRINDKNPGAKKTPDR